MKLGFEIARPWAYFFSQLLMQVTTLQDQVSQNILDEPDIRRYQLNFFCYYVDGSNSTTEFQQKQAMNIQKLTNGIAQKSFLKIYLLPFAYTQGFQGCRIPHTIHPSVPPRVTF